MTIDDSYRVERVLAQGAGGVTELVTLEGTGPFVRKRIPAKLARRRVWAELAECGCARLPHVEATYELPDCFVVVYDFVPGETLEDHVASAGRLERREAARLVTDICEAAGALHARDIIYRDISPSNVIVAADGAHLIDLGIARMRVEGASHDTTSLGTWGFASPEQYGFAQTDARSDVYSIGRLLGYLLTGVRPDADEYDKLLADDAVVSPGLRSVIERACAFEPSARYQSAAAMAAALAPGKTHEPMRCPSQPEGSVTHAAEDVLNADGPAAHPKSNVPERRRLGIALGVAGAAVAVAVGGYLLISNTGSETYDTSGNVPASTPAQAAATTSPLGGMSPALQGAQGKTVPGDARLSIVEQGWSVSSEGYVMYALALRNESASATIMYPGINVVGRAEDGSVLFSDEQRLMAIGPGETVYFGSQAGNGMAPATVEFDVIEPQAYQIAGEESAPSVDFAISNTGETVDSLGNLNFTGELTAHGTPQGQLAGTSQAAVSVVLRDSAGAIIYGASTFVSLPADGEATAFQIPAYGAPDYASYEIHAQIW